VETAEGVTDPTTGARDTYSPHRRTALVFSGTGTAGAYHAGVLRALAEAGVKIDVVAGCGIGAATALFAAIDGGARLWQPDGVWRAPGIGPMYGWRPAIRVALGLLALAAACVVAPVLAVIAGLVIYPVEFFLHLTGLTGGIVLGQGYARFLAAAFEPAALPTILPRVATLALTGLVIALAVTAFGAARRMRLRPGARPGFWWALAGSPLDARRIGERLRRGLWALMSGLPGRHVPDTVDFSRRYSELLAENLGQPGFRELVLLAHDLDARRDLVFAMLRPALRGSFFRPGGDRASEAFDFAAVGRDHLVDALLGAVTLPVATDPHLIQLSPEGFWQGETHRLVSRPGSVVRLLDEVHRAGAEQVVLVAATAALRSPHVLVAARSDARSRLGEYLAAADTAAVRDAVATGHRDFACLFEIRPDHNPLGALDFAGEFDTGSDRRYPLDELVARGYEDAYRQFIDPVVAVSGESLEVDFNGRP
jgi:hypothetical protein